MNYHIIKAGETIKMIAKNYELLERELGIKNNMYILCHGVLVPPPVYNVYHTHYKNLVT